MPDHNEDKGFLIVINPRAAQGRTVKWWQRIRPQLEKRGVRFDFIYTTAPGSAAVQVREALQNGYQKIIAVGGDGTVNEAANGFLREGEPINKEAAFGFWAAGTGNDLARSVYQDKSDKAFIALLENWQVRHTDIGKVTFSDFNGQKTVRYYLNDFTVGLGADTCYIVNNSSKKLGGKISFFVAALKAILAYRLQPISVVIDGKETVEDRFILVSCSNGAYFGGGMMIAPQAETDDGKMDLVMAAGLNKREIVALLIKVYTGKHLQNSNVSYRKIKSLRIESAARLLMEVDGETPGLLPVELEVLPGKLPLLTPRA